MNLKQHVVTGARNTKLNVVEWGNPDGAEVIFIHGWSQSLLCWSEQYESPDLQGFRLIGIDLRGHGKSEAPVGDNFYNESNIWAEDLDAVISALNLKFPILIGWSYGGLVITDYLKRFGDKSLSGILFAGATTQLNEEALGTYIGRGFTDYIEGALSDNSQECQEAMRFFVDNCFAKKLSREKFDAALEWNLKVRPDVRGSLTNRDVDNTSVLKKATVPVLIAHGQLDDVVLPGMAKLIKENCHDAELSWYEDVAHAPFLEDTHRFNDELACFVEKTRNK